MVQGDLLLNLEGIKEHEKLYEQDEDEALGMFLEGIKSTNSEIQEHLDNEKSVVSQIIKSELNHDLPTGKLTSSLHAVKLSSLAVELMFVTVSFSFVGHTPVRKSHGSIPKLASLASPIMKKVKSRVQNAIVLKKRALRSPRVCQMFK